MKWMVLLGSLFASVATDCAAQAATWPTKPVKIMVGASAGGGNVVVGDLTAHVHNGGQRRSDPLQKLLATLLGQWLSRAHHDFELAVA